MSHENQLVAALYQRWLPRSPALIGTKVLVLTDSPSAIGSNKMVIFFHFVRRAPSSLTVNKESMPV